MEGFGGSTDAGDESCSITRVTYHVLQMDFFHGSASLFLVISFIMASVLAEGFY